MTFDKINRRTHLYLAMLLLPWFFVYGVSSLVFNHSAWFSTIYKDVPQWELLFERDYQIDLQPQGDLTLIGNQILNDTGLRGFVTRAETTEGHLNVYVFDFRAPKALRYFSQDKLLRVEGHTFRWDRFLSRLHAFGGFDYDSRLAIAWAVLIDVVMLSIVIWIATGLYMWYQIRHTRFWGLFAMGVGIVTMLGFILGL